MIERSEKPSYNAGLKRALGHVVFSKTLKENIVGTVVHTHYSMSDYESVFKSLMEKYMLEKQEDTFPFQWDCSTWNAYPALKNEWNRIMGCINEKEL